MKLPDLTVPRGLDLFALATTLVIPVYLSGSAQSFNKYTDFHDFTVYTTPRQQYLLVIDFIAVESSI